MDTNEVSIAFEILLEELEAVVNALNADGAEAFQGGEYDRARQLIEDATRLTDFHDRARALQAEWQAVFKAKAPPAKPGRRRSLGKLSRGLRTPEDAFRKPILDTLVAMGGSAPMNKVIDAVGKKLAGVLNKYDHERLPSGPAHEIRWRNTAEWCRNKMARDGLLKTDSPRGVWEISESGTRALRGMP